jgi:hypothetical protein
MILTKSQAFQVTLLLAGITNIACLAKVVATSNGALFKLGTDIGTIVMVCSAIAVLLIFLGLINLNYLPVRKRKKQSVRFFVVMNSPSVLLLGAEALMLFLILIYALSRIRLSI